MYTRVNPSVGYVIWESLKILIRRKTGLKGLN